MSSINVTNIKHPSSASNNIVLDASGNVNIDSNTLYVDATNNRVGVGTSTVNSLLEVRGTTDGQNVLHLSNNAGAGDGQAENQIRVTCNGNTNWGNLDIQAFQTIFTQNGAERARIDSSGRLLVGTTNNSPAFNNVQGIALDGANGVTASCRDGNTTALFGRKTNDGNIVEFYQDGTVEGSISVSGTTVSYNGAHLSRWSQIPGIDSHDKDQRPEILRGTVMSNLDEMCDWIDPESGDAQDNEQLNKTKISDVEGDKNVAGIFQSWDDDDDTWVNDYYLAMTGDFIIRIAEGVTVERGDLLMSAGDGTAKPQGDGYVQDKTIAKVTSTNVSCTYDDGSYCVPCVLMAC